MEVRPLSDLPEISEGDVLGALLVESSAPSGEDIVVCSQKIVSKAEGRVIAIDQVEPSKAALDLASEVKRDPRLVELVLRESRKVIRAVANRLIVETNSGWVCANAGIDASNLPHEGTVCLLPVDADASARRIRSEIDSASGQRPAVLIADSFGRAWRLGQAEAAIGCAGIDPIDDWDGREDSHGRRLESTRIATADHLAGAADLIRRKDSQIPGAVISGLGYLVRAEDGPGATVLQRPESEDLFR